MIELALEAIDRIITLLQGRVDDRRRFFHEQIDPIFKDMEIIHKNYTSSFTDIIAEAEKINDVQELIDLVMNKKMELEHIRVKIHSFTQIALTSDHIPDLSKRFFESCISYFEGHKDTFSVSEYSSMFSRFQNLLYEIEKNSDVNLTKDLLVNYFGECLNQSRSNWGNITKEYSKCKIDMLR